MTDGMAQDRTTDNLSIKSVKKKKKRERSRFDPSIHLDVSFSGVQNMYYRVLVSSTRLHSFPPIIACSGS